MPELKTKPDLRFAEFDDEWVQRKLGDHAEILTGGTPTTSVLKYWEPKEIPWLSSGEVNKRRLDSTDDMISKEGLSQSSARWVKAYSVLIALAGQGKTRGTVAVNMFPLTTNQSVAAIVPDETLHYEFIFQNLLKRYEELRMLSSGDGSRGGLNKQLVSNVYIKCPDVTEQKLIGCFFATLDILIALHQRKYDKTISIKKAMLEKMFPREGESKPEIRFAGFTEDWEYRKLYEISDKVREKNTNRFYTETLTNSAEFGVIAQSDYFDKKISNEENINNYYIVKNDDFVYNPRISSFAPVGPIRRNRLNRTGIMSPLYYVFRSKGIDLTYLEYFFSGSGWHRFMKLNGDSGARSDRFSIKDSMFKEMPIPYPLHAEQKKIGQFFSALDTLLALHQRELTKLKNIKKALLEKMFV